MSEPSQGMTKSEIVCPGSPTLLDEKNQPIIHYLVRDPSNPKPNLICPDSRCQFQIRYFDGGDYWNPRYIPAVIPK